MVTIRLDPAKEKHLRELAAAQGKDAEDLIRQVVEDYLDFQASAADTPEAWAEASVAVTPEVMSRESWEDEDKSDGSRRGLVG